jgi:lysophospholipase L1-like esterase
VRLVVIWFGANDASLPGFPSKFHVPLDTFSDNITAIVRGLRDPASDHFLPDARVILITPPPVDPVRTKTEIYDMISHPRLVGLDRSDELVKQYARVTKEVGDREGVPVIDAYTTIWAKAGGRDASLLRPFFADGLHLNAEGNKVRSSSDMLKRPQALFVSQVVFELLMETISSQYPELKPENLPLGFPE